MITNQHPCQQHRVLLIYIDFKSLSEMAKFCNEIALINQLEIILLEHQHSEWELTKMLNNLLRRFIYWAANWNSNHTNLNRHKLRSSISSLNVKITFCKSLELSLDMFYCTVLLYYTIFVKTKNLKFSSVRIEIRAGAGAFQKGHVSSVLINVP